MCAFQMARGRSSAAALPIVQAMPSPGRRNYDAMIAASALHAGCDTLRSENLQHGMALDEGLRIVNPFHDAS
jgi:predicted nucleic acid-binding protein